MRLFLSLLLASTLVLAGETREPQTLFTEGHVQFEAKNFKGAVSLLEQAVEDAPQNAEYIHLLGKAYGRLAEQSGWGHAMILAVKARKAFEQAVELDPNFRDALEDLAHFYNSAPRFLGGDKEKAKRMKLRATRVSIS